MMDSDDITGDILSAIQSIHNTLQVSIDREIDWKIICFRISVFI